MQEYICVGWSNHVRGNWLQKPWETNTGDEGDQQAGEGSRARPGRSGKLVAANLRQGFLDEVGLELGPQEGRWEAMGRAWR